MIYHTRRGSLTRLDCRYSGRITVQLRAGLSLRDPEASNV
jgi:hypothetical protein